MNKDIIVISFFGYGISLQYRKDDFKNIDGTLDKHSIRLRNPSYTNPHIALTFFYNYNFIVRLLIGRG